MPGVNSAKTRGNNMAIARKLLTDFGTLKENCGNMDARRMDNLCEELQALMRVPELITRFSWPGSACNPGSSSREE